ncbi:MAG: 16S rRNA (guanine(527)-N(7))-methyltransferase RsmG [Oscillospiraceae bacterium]|nr:16S rRNA (guanine(527)-N(7))-methyltransferase RsmG [Oscillospiraceae bacterium]MCI9549366.1 16S rRNA (guanine(527)-N(7))-methyltransferase RsmG [Oscillospiraceae bacterium]
MEALIRTGLAQLGQAGRVPEDAPALLARYGALLLEKNRVMNLTAITQPQDVATLHMLDCAALLDCARFEGKTLIDVGTGAGFPGLPLKILTPSLEVTLLDSLNKRVDWLNETIDTLGLKGVRAVHGRAEEAGRDPAFRERFDFAAARAVADLRLLCELCLPFLKVGGRFLAMKGTDCGDEVDKALPAIQVLGGRLEGRIDRLIPHTDVTHRVVLVEKTSPTPEKYPRRWAKMQKVPL